MTYITKEAVYDLLADLEAVCPEAVAAFRVAVADMKAENEALRGVVVCGYQGIGKSTLANKSPYVVDLESSAFFVGGERPERWHEMYCQTAFNIARQGRLVLLSSHAVVREYLRENKPLGLKLVVCYPTAELREKWIEKLEGRFRHSNDPKDYRALVNAECRYSESIKELSEEKGFIHAVIDRVDYDLGELIGRVTAPTLEQEGK